MGKYLKQNYMLYIMLMPSVVYVVIFNILPLCGIIIAFKDFDIFAVTGNLLKSIQLSPWVGFKHFDATFSNRDFARALINTLIISLYKIIFTFPLPIMFAIMLNEMNSDRFKKVLLLIVCLPHFLSWVIVSGVFISLLASNGAINNMLDAMGMVRINFLMSSSMFRSILVISDSWKELGWNSIIYFAAIMSLDQECYEAAEVDGANRSQKILHVTIPGLMPTIILMLIIRIGGIMDAGFSQIFVMYNPTVYDVSDIIGTYVFRMCLGKLEFSVGTAVGLFNSIASLVFVVASNFIAKRLTGKSIW